MENTLDILLLLSDRLMAEMVTYEKILCQIQDLGVALQKLVRKFQVYNLTDLNLKTVRLLTLTGVQAMYEEYRKQKWEEMNMLKENIHDLAVSVGFHENQLFQITQQLDLQDQTTVGRSTVCYWSQQHSQFSRLE